MIFRRAAVAAALCLAAGGAAAAEAPSYVECQHAAGGITVRLRDCNVAELTRLDAILNQTYQSVLAALPATRQERLRTAERSWLAYADAECVFQTSAEAGASDAPLVAESCRISLITERTAQLQQALKITQAPN